MSINTKVMLPEPATGPEHMVTAAARRLESNGRYFSTIDDYMAAVTNVERGLLRPEDAVLAFTDLPEISTPGYLPKPTSERRRSRSRTPTAERLWINYGTINSEIIYGERMQTANGKKNSTSNGHTMGREAYKAQRLLEAISSDEPNWKYARELFNDIQNAHRAGRRVFQGEQFNQQFLHDIGSIVLQQASVRAYLRQGESNPLAGYLIQKR